MQALTPTSARDAIAADPNIAALACGVLQSRLTLHVRQHDIFKSHVNFIHWRRTNLSGGISTVAAGPDKRQRRERRWLAAQIIGT